VHFELIQPAVCFLVSSEERNRTPCLAPAVLFLVLPSAASAPDSHFPRSSNIRTTTCIPSQPECTVPPKLPRIF